MKTETKAALFSTALFTAMLACLIVIFSRVTLPAFTITGVDHGSGEPFTATMEMR